MKKNLLIIPGAVFFLVLFPKLASAATLYASPASGTFGVGSNFSVTIKTNTSGAAVNTAEASITYSTDTLELLSVRQGSTFSLISPGSPAKGSGTAYFAGGLPTPGYTGAGGNVGVLNFRAKALGTGTVSISSGKVLLNDGNGTDVYSGSSGATFKITQPTAPPPVPGAVVVSSSSHPDQNTWYLNRDVVLSWSRPDKVTGFSFIFDQSPDTVPDDQIDATDSTTKNYDDVADGTWYFHIKDKSNVFGPSVHFRVQIDGSAPQPFDITLTDLTITFATTDGLSGMLGYDVYLDNIPVKQNAVSPYTFDQLTGPHEIKVAAYDKAGNIVFSKLDFGPSATVKLGFFQRKLSLPLYMFIMIIFFFLLLLILIIWWLLTRKRKTEEEKLQAEIQKDLEKKRQINKHLEELKQRVDSANMH